jgi:hypothetical protein
MRERVTNYSNDHSAVANTNDQLEKKMLVLIKPICSETVRSGLKAWLNAVDDLRSSFSWVVDDSDVKPSGHDLIITDLGHMDEALRWSQDKRIPVALWGGSERISAAVPQLRLPVSAAGFVEFVDHCSELVTRARVPSEFSRPISFPL